VSIYKSGGVDFDNLFDPDTVGDGPSAPNFKQGGVPLKYAALKYGTKRPDVGYAQAGVDVSNLWAQKGSSVYALPCDGDNAATGEVLTNGQTGYAYAQFIIKADGTFTFRTVRSPNPSINDTNVVATGTWNTAGGVASGYQVRFTLSNFQYPIGSSAGTSTTNDAAAFTTISADRQVSIRADGDFNAGTHEIKADLKIELLRISDGVVFSATNVSMDVHVDGSV
jgi:hypothetical protein